MDAKKQKSRLGRGLSSLMGVGNDFGPTTTDVLSPSTELPADSEVLRGTPLDLDVSVIDPNPNQPRRSFTEAMLRELADSIRENGVIQPIVVRRQGDRYQLIAGERRLRASKLADRPTIPAFIRDADDLTQAQLALVENIQREDLNPIDRAAGYRTLIGQLGLTQVELALRLGEDRSTIANHLRLLDLAPDVIDLIREAKLTLGHAKVLAGVGDAAEQSRLASLAAGQELSVRNLERLIASPQASDAAAPTKGKVPASAHIRDLEVNLSKQLGLRVQVRASANKAKGKLVIHYQTLDEFDALMEKVGVTLGE